MHVLTRSVGGKTGVCFEGAAIRAKLARLEEKELDASRKWFARRVKMMPFMWRRHLEAEHSRRGGLTSSDANGWLLDQTRAADGRLSLAAGDWEIREAAVEARRAAYAFASREIYGGGDMDSLRLVLEDHCRSWGIKPAEQEGRPGLMRMLDDRWYLRRLRRAFGRRAEGAAIGGGVVRRGLWPYASQDAVLRRQSQRKRNAAAMERAVVIAADGEKVDMVEIVKGSLANPENKRAELMVRIRGCDDVSRLRDWACEFWTMTAPSRFHPMRIGEGGGAEKNQGWGELIVDDKGRPVLDAWGKERREPLLPSDAQRHLCRVWAQIRAALHRRGIYICGLRTAEPHHDGCPHWHLVVYGSPEDLTFARHIARWYCLLDSGEEAGALEHRFNFKVAASGTGAAAYAAAYVSKNIDGGGMDGDRDSETGQKVSSAVKRVDAWASHWGIRQFQFFGMPKVGIWRALRRVDCSGGRVDAVEKKVSDLLSGFGIAGKVGADDLVGGQVESEREERRVRASGLPDGCALEDARRCADDSDWCGFWLACERGGLALVKSSVERLTDYGDAAAAVVTGVCEGGRRLLLKVRDWVIHWGGKAKNSGVLVLDLPRSGVINCTGDDPKRAEREAKERKIFAINAEFAGMAAAVFAVEAEFAA